jgi:hypothetical protein
MHQNRLVRCFTLIVGLIALSTALVGCASTPDKQQAPPAQPPGDPEALVVRGVPINLNPQNFLIRSGQTRVVQVTVEDHLIDKDSYDISLSDPRGIIGSYTRNYTHFANDDAQTFTIRFTAKSRAPAGQATFYVRHRTISHTPLVGTIRLSALVGDPDPAESPTALTNNQPANTESPQAHPFWGDGRPKALAVYAGGEHSIFTDRTFPGGPELNARVKAATQELVIAFLAKAFEARGEPMSAWRERHSQMLARFAQEPGQA